MRNVFGCKRANVYNKICNQMYCMNKQLIPWLSEKGILDAPKKSGSWTHIHCIIGDRL